MPTRTFEFSPLVTDDGHFKGYGAVFGNTDSHRDVIRAGAFRASLDDWRRRGRWPAMKLQHGTSGNPFNGDDLPVGRWLSMKEDARGLWVEGQLLALDTDLGRRLASLMKGGVLDALSIGFVAKKTTPSTGRVARYLDEVDLREVSIVDVPSNDFARIEAVSPADIAFERLRDSLANVGAKSTDTAFDRLKTSLAKLDRQT